MSELVNKVAELLNAPVDLVQRSAEARAAASGKSVDEVLSSWACLLYTSDAADE